MARKKPSALAYLRTSSATNVGTDRDSDKRQAEAIRAYADRAGFEVVETFYDAAVSGADPIEERNGFSALLDRIEANGVRTVIVEDQSRFARDMQAHVLGLALLRERGVRLIASNGTDLTDETDEMTEAMIHIAAVFSALEKKRLVKKLKAARDRKRAKEGKCEGRKSRSERLRLRLLKGAPIDGKAAAIRSSVPSDLVPQLPDDLTHAVSPDLANRLADAVEARTVEAIAMAKRLRRASPKTGERISLRRISTKLAEAGHLNERGQPFHPNSIKMMIEG